MCNRPILLTVAGFLLILIVPTPIALHNESEMHYLGLPRSFWRHEILIRPRMSKYTPLNLKDAQPHNSTGAPLGDDTFLPLRTGNSTCIPMLMVLLDDPDPYVRGYCVDTLGALGYKARIALSVLQSLQNDKAICAFGVSVSEKAKEAVANIENSRGEKNTGNAVRDRLLEEIE